jgi:hypothetical protein
MHTKRRCVLSFFSYLFAFVRVLFRCFFAFQADAHLLPTPPFYLPGAPPVTIADVLKNECTTTECKASVSAVEQAIADAVAAAAADAAANINLGDPPPPPGLVSVCDISLPCLNGAACRDVTPPDDPNPVVLDWRCECTKFFADR